VFHHEAKRFDGERSGRTRFSWEKDAHIKSVRMGTPHLVTAAGPASQSEPGGFTMELNDLIQKEAIA
jgi:hypothetical protein